MDRHLQYLRRVTDSSAPWEARFGYALALVGDCIHWNDVDGSKRGNVPNGSITAVSQDYRTAFLTSTAPIIKKSSIDDFVRAACACGARVYNVIGMPGSKLEAPNDWQYASVEFHNTNPAPRLYVVGVDILTKNNTIPDKKTLYRRLLELVAQFGHHPECIVAFMDNPRKICPTVGRAIVIMVIMIMCVALGIWIGRREMSSAITVYGQPPDCKKIYALLHDALGYCMNEH